MPEEIAVRPFDRSALTAPVSKIIVEIFPTANYSYLASWDIHLTQSNEGEYNVGEIQALADACFAAGTQIREVLQAIDDYEEDDDDAL